MSAPCQKKKRTRSPASFIGIHVRHVSDTNMSPKMACQCNLAAKPSYTYEIYGVYKFLELSSNFKIVSKFPFYFLSYVLKPNKKLVPSYPFVSSVTLG